MARTGTRGARAITSSSHRRPRDAIVSDIPDIYHEMLESAVSSSPSAFDDNGRPPKRRRVAGRLVVSQDGQDKSALKQEPGSETAADTDGDIDITLPSKLRQQVVYDDSEESAGSDMDWEEVDLRDNVKHEDTTPEPGELNLILGGNIDSASKSTVQRRKPVTAEERKLRLEIHKMHILSLLVHVHLRNHWCNDHETQKVLRKLLPKKTLSYLDDDESQSQFQRSRSFMEGLEQASEVFRTKFKITARGMSRSYWAEDAEHLAESNVPTDIDLPIDKSDFRVAATKLQASRDVGAQLFCSLLRSTGTEARLVCSLQPLPFTATLKGTTPVKPKPAFTVSYVDTRIGISDEESAADGGSDTSIRTAGSTSTNGTVSRIKSRLATRLGRTQPSNTNAKIATPPPIAKPRPKAIRESPYPVYWVEAFNAAIQKWVTVDPLVTKTIAKPSKFEPPASDIENNMAYVLAFEDDGSVRDVTRRYAKAYNAKTRKTRVEITKGGEKWRRRVLRIYKRGYELDRDQVEDAELRAKEAAEGMPRNVQDFKDHPYYALERHLRRNEVIHPKREVGKVTAGKSSANSGKALESVYRRRDVHMVKSADSWYRLGREIKTGEQPLKRVQPRRRRDVVSEEELSGDEENAGTGMYAAFQTITYEAPPVVRGIIPKNAYGNLDIYVPSMVPPGGVHIVHADTARAARILGIDYADAVTGFEFKGRFGTAVIKGAVVAREYQEAVEEVIGGFEYERAEAEEDRRSREALRMWRRFLAGLRIRERIEGYEIEGERDAIQQEMRQVDEDVEEDDGGGGFLPDRDDEAGAEPTAGRSFQPLTDYDYEDGGGFMDEASDDGSQDEEYHAVRSVAGTDINRTVPPDYVGGGGFLEDEDMHDEDLEDKDAEDAMHEVELSAQEDRITHHENPRASIESDAAENETSVIRHDTPYLHAEPLPPTEFHHGLDEREFEEARLLQQIHESERLNDTSSPEDAVEEREDNSSSGLAPLLEDDATPVVSEPLQMIATIQDTEEAGKSVEPEPRVVESGPLEGAAISDVESEISKGSLLSHDPSDEDAEPEWMSQFE